MKKNIEINKLISLKVKNILSFLEKTEISFLKKTTKNHQRGFYTFSDKRDKIKISNIYGIYGTNSSGKSNLIINIISILKKIIRSKNAQNLIFFVPFFESQKKVSQIAIKFLTNSKLYNFEIKFKNNVITHEKLEFKEKASHSYKNVYKKINKNFVLGTQEPKKINLENETIIGNASMFDVILKNMNIKIIDQFFYKQHFDFARNFILNKIQLIGTGTINLDYAFSLLEQDKEILTKFNKIAKEVKLGFDKIECQIVNVPVKDFEVKGKMNNSIESFRIKDKIIERPIAKFLRFVDEENKFKEIPRLGAILSNGTLQFVKTIVFLLSAIKKNYVVLWDEFGCFLDDELINALFKIVENSDSVQLIFNSNKKTIIPKLDWDQILITKVNRHLESSIIKLKSIMQQSGIEKKYRNNYFGNLNDFSVISILKSLD